VLLPETPLKGAFEVAERIRNAIAARPLEMGDRRIVSTVSVGIATFPEDGASLDSLAAHADRAMYSAKQAGRNRSIKFREMAA
jgi:diguanylate cyclase (GGDEF)-like protein